MLTQEQKQIILESIEREINLRNNTKGKGGAERFAVFVGIDASQISRVRKGELSVLSDGKWFSIARKLGVELRPGAVWNVAKTPTFKFIFEQLRATQLWSSSMLLVDDAGIGKTFTAEQYARDNKNVAYIDCSQVKSKQRLVRNISTAIGLSANGRYADVYDDLVYTLKSIEQPLIILDEAGDLDYPAFLELKALWNATKLSVGWYMMGADGLKAKMERNLVNIKVGYSELFSRFLSRYQTVLRPEGFDELQMMTVAKANGYKGTAAALKKATEGGSLRRVYLEIQKQRNHA